MAEQHTSEQIEKFILAEFESHKQDPKVEVTRNSQITGDLSIDSLAVMEIVSELEDHYDLEFSDDDLPKVHTVGDVIDLVEQALRSAGRLA